MPKINKREIKEKPVKYKSERKKEQADYYNSLAWKRLRNTYISLHPLCQFCLDNGKVEPATEVHHAVPYMRGSDEQEKWELFLDEKNLIPLCSKCHTAVHTKDNMYHMGRLDNLTEKEWKYAHFILD